jgi:DNA-directed RNA polymerase subunit RPC12/RpoP
MGICKLREGIKWICSQCGKNIPIGEGIQINYKPYCELCGEKEFKKFKLKVKNIFKEEK